MPNPYTKSFIKTCNPKYVLSTIISYLESHPEEKNLGAICFNIWEEPIGNLPNLKYVLNEYSKVITINNSNEVILQPNYKEIMKEQLDRNDKKKFYDIVGGISCRTSDTKPIVPTDDEISLVSQQYSYISAI